MKPRLTQLVSLLALIALAFVMAGAPLQASIITLTGGDAADASDSIGYAPVGTPVYAYRITTINSGVSPVPNYYLADQSAYVYKGITFQPFVLLGGSSNTSSNVSTSGSVTITDGFFYQAGAAPNVGSGGGSLSSDDTALFNLAKYQSFGATTYNGSNALQTLTLGGLVSGQTYQVDAFGANITTDAYTYTTTGGVGGPGPFTDNTGTRTAGVVYDVRNTLVANSSGQIIVTVIASLSGDNATFNAFSVELTPEPASMALLACGSLLLLRRRHA